MGKIVDGETFSIFLKDQEYVVTTLVESNNPGYLLRYKLVFEGKEMYLKQEFKIAEDIEPFFGLDPYDELRNIARSEALIDFFFIVYEVKDRNVLWDQMKSLHWGTEPEPDSLLAHYHKEKTRNNFSDM